jgi:hypothetical protein
MPVDRDGNQSLRKRQPAKQSQEHGRGFREFHLLIFSAACLLGREPPVLAPAIRGLQGVGCELEIKLQAELQDARIESILDLSEWSWTGGQIR